MGPSDRSLQGQGRRGIVKTLPAGSAGAALGGDRRGVLELDESARHHLPAPAQHSRRLGHRRQRPGHGVRQYGRDLGHRRRLHPQSIDRRKAALWRVPGECAGRGRRGRHAHAAKHHRGGPHRCRFRQAVAAEADAGGICAFRRHLRAPGKTLSRHAGSRIHHRARQAVDAADALRQAHGEGGDPHRRRDGQGRAAVARGGHFAGRPGLARPVAASHHRSQGGARHHRHRPAGFAGGGDRRDRVFVRRCRGDEGARAARSCWCASRPAPRTSTACTPPKAS